uniref:Uncharacterized protein n=1 Tax=Aegilops tauschii subsp. strangulata TaxID=200361 RepID=A0A453Q8Q8_AEGTS
GETCDWLVSTPGGKSKHKFTAGQGIPAPREEMKRKRGEVHGRIALRRALPVCTSRRVITIWKM